ncbi:MAG: glycine--tRNA ligase [Thermoplasmata archaeon]
MGSRYDEVMSLSVRKGFIWPTADIYGGFGGFYDYGHLGASLKRKWEDVWLRHFVTSEENYHLVDTSNVLPYKSLKASGHVEHFTDVMAECSKCGESFRGDQLLEDVLGVSAEGMSPEEIDAKIGELNLKCPDCGGDFGTTEPFNMMFPVFVGPAGTERAFLRPETAQGVYLNFKREFEALRRRLPMGLAIMGRAFRNEISPRQGAYRMREFLQAELQIFFDPEQEDFPSFVSPSDFERVKLRVSFEEDREKILELGCQELLDRDLPWFYVSHMAKVQGFYLDVLKYPPEKFRFAELGEGERAFYNKIHFDIQISMDSLGGFREVAGVHYRTDHDLSGHEKESHEKMRISREGRKFIPHVLELSFGIDRNIWSLLDTFYEKDERSILKLPTVLAPIQAGVFPLLSRDGLPELAEKTYRILRKDFDCFYDSSGSIGRRYARMDEIGTPYCITVDHQSLKDNDVTIRERDTTDQVREGIDVLPDVLGKLLRGR